MMKGFIWIAGAMLCVLVSCSRSPRPIEYGKDECAFCKMTIMDKRFGCEIMNTKGKAIMFDDLSCLLTFRKMASISEADIAAVYLPDFAGTAGLMDAGQLYFVASEAFRSPMAGNVAAFSSKDSAEAFVQRLEGKLVTWNELTKDE